MWLPRWQNRSAVRTLPFVFGSKYVDLDEQKVLRLRRRERIRELRDFIVVATRLGLPLYAVFCIADYFYAPRKFLLFACLRTLVVPSCVVVNIAVLRTRNLTKMQLWGTFHVFVNAILITIMAFLAEGKGSPYYAGLNLIAILVGSFIPWTFSALLWNFAVIYLPFFVLSFLGWGKPGNSIFIVNSFFMVCTIVLILVIRHYNEEFRMSAIRSKVALDDELDRRAQIIQEKTEEATRLEAQFRQAQKMEAMGRLAGGIAHDFNNLLMVIQSYTEMLRDDLPAADGLRNNTEQILKAATRAGSLTRQMLAFSRKQILSPVVLDLNAVIEDAAKMLKRLIGEDIEFRVLPAESLWKVEADPDQIVQVVMNLCVNARDAMAQGGTLTIATRNVAAVEMGATGCPEAPSGEYVKFSVADTGIGISKAMQEHLFEPFFTTKEVGKGTGLGLATVYGIVKQSGGHMRIDSELGQGACFTIYLPRVKQAIAPESSSEPEFRPRGMETILVVEDEEALREAMRDYLQSLGYTVLAACAGPQALALSAGHKGPIDLLISDVVMPAMSGRELSEKLRQQRPNLRTIFMSGYTDDEVLRRGVQKLGAAFLQKPFSLATLALDVRTMLGRNNHDARTDSPDR
jgi:signal transduction histidine kinase/CheY-like chemotaxis protein